MSVTLEVNIKDLNLVVKEKEPRVDEALVAKISTCKYHENLRPIYFIELSDGRCFKCEEYDQGLNNVLSNQ